ncbi:MAG: hypothetical protein O9256_00660 [Rhizobiaceae bacterium]|nr:hypothetical protein [Rhizobiaceae bacterium]
MSDQDHKNTLPGLSSSDASTVTKAEATSGGESSSFGWLWSGLLAFFMVKLFGVVGGLVTLGSYYVLKAKLGTWGAVVASGVIGASVSIGLLALIRN